MLTRNYRLTAYNDSGAAVDITVTVRRWKFDTDGAIVYEDTESTLLSTTGTEDATLATGTSQDNTTDKWIGIGGIMTLENGTGTGVVTLFLEPSTDDGTTWPVEQRGIPLVAGIPDDNDRVAFTA